MLLAWQGVGGSAGSAGAAVVGGGVDRVQRVAKTSRERILRDPKS